MRNALTCDHGRPGDVQYVTDISLRASLWFPSLLIYGERNGPSDARKCPGAGLLLPPCCVCVCGGWFTLCLCCWGSGVVVITVLKSSGATEATKGPLEPWSAGLARANTPRRGGREQGLEEGPGMPFGTEGSLLWQPITLLSVWLSHTLSTTYPLLRPRGGFSLNQALLGDSAYYWCVSVSSLLWSYCSLWYAMVDFWPGWHCTFAHQVCALTHTKMYLSKQKKDPNAYLKVVKLALMSVHGTLSRNEHVCCWLLSYNVWW